MAWWGLAVAGDVDGSDQDADRYHTHEQGETDNHILVHGILQVDGFILNILINIQNTSIN